MKSVVTIKLKVPKNKLLLRTMKQYSKAIEYISSQGFKSNVTNRYKLHHLTYYKVRSKFKLPSQFIINAIRIASQTLKSVKTNKGSKPVFKEYMPLDFDRRTFTFSSEKVRLTTSKGRIDIPITIPGYYWKYLDWRYQTAKFIYDKKRDRMFLHISFSRDIAIPSNSDGFHGVDVGINNVAVTSDRQFFNSNRVKLIKSRYRYLRRRLQGKGTRSSRRLLKKISGREKRFIKQCNHEISKAIVSKCNVGDTIAMEDIKGIRGCRVSKEQRYWLNNWSFYQLQRFIDYKAKLKGCRVIYIDPRNTSKRCSKCFSLNTIRKSSDFHCLNCSYHLNSDLNASLNLKLSGRFLTNKADVNQLHIPNVESKAILSGTADEFRDKPFPIR